MRKALFKKGLERNCKSKNVLEIDEEKDGVIIFWQKTLFKKDHPFNLEKTRMKTSIDLHQEGNLWRERK